MKAYIIYLKEVLYTCEMAELCLRSAKAYGWNAELFAGYYKKAGEVYMHRHGYTLISTQAPYYDPKSIYIASGKEYIGKGTIGCSASHYALWHKCVQLNENLTVFEHDAEIIGPPPQATFEDYLMLGPRTEYIETRGNIMSAIEPTGATVQDFRFHYDDWDIFQEKLVATGKYQATPADPNHGVSTAATTLAYTISPQGAAKLLADVKRWGYAPVDRQIRTPVVNIQITMPIVVDFQKGTEIISLTLKQRSPILWIKSQLFPRMKISYWHDFIYDTPQRRRRIKKLLLLFRGQ